PAINQPFCRSSWEASDERKQCNMAMTNCKQKMAIAERKVSCSTEASRTRQPPCLLAKHTFPYASIVKASLNRPSAPEEFQRNSAMVGPRNVSDVGSGAVIDGLA